MISTLTRALQTRPAWAHLAGRRRVAAGLLLLGFGFGFVVMFPTWVVLPADDEGLFTGIAPTVYQAQHLFTAYPFWNPLIGFGVPQSISNALIFHPFVVLLTFAPLAFSIALLYQVQFWIGIFSVWAVCRHLGMRRWIASVCVVTFVLSAATIDFFHDFWPDQFVMWTLSPLLLLLMLKLLDSEQRLRLAFYGVSTGLCAALMLLDGHAGVYPVFVVAFVAFLLGQPRRLLVRWPWFCLALLVTLLAVSTKVYDIALETARTAAGSKHPQQSRNLDFGRLFLYPFRPQTTRDIAVGGPFVVLMLVGLFWPRVSRRYTNGLRIAVAVSFAAWYFPTDVVSFLTGTWYFGQPFTLFGVFLAGLALQTLWDRLPRYARPILLAAAAFQIVVMVWGFYTSTYRADFRRALDYLDGKQVLTLRNDFENQELYRYFEQRPDHASTRVYMAPLARNRLWRSLSDYEFVVWSFHGLRLVNGHFRGVDVHEFQYQKETLHGEIRGEWSLWKQTPDNLPTAGSVLDELNIGYVLATPGEAVASSLVPLRRFRLGDGTVIEAYRNPSAWPDAVVLSPEARRIKNFPTRPGCEIPGLLCDNLSGIKALRRPGVVTRQTWHGTTLDVQLTPLSRPSVLMLSQMYRPGWQAKLSDGRTVDGYRLFGAVTGFDLPAGTRSVEIEFSPTSRMVFAALSWATLFVSVAFLLAVAVRTRRRAGKTRLR